VIRLICFRVLWSIPLLWVVSALTFVLVSVVPGNAAQAILGGDASSAQMSSLSQQLGLNQPLWTQYWHWLYRVLHGDLGTSLVTGQSVTSMLNSRLTVSLTLIIGGTLVASVFGVFFGVWAATRGGVLGRLVEVGGVVGLAVPNFWLALVLIELFAVTVRIFPAIAAVGMTIIAVQTRDSMMEVLRRDFVLVLEANGISRRSVLYRHALRNAAIPVVTVIGITFVGLLGASVLVESVFALPGLGSGLSTAASQHDIPVIQGAVIYFTLVVVAVNLLVDLAYALLNPRMRVS
jgi:peptide/nickel transport system permease protein